MSWLQIHQRTAWICGLTLLLPLAFYLNILLGLWGARQEAQAAVERLQPRIARLQGLVEHEEQLREASVKVDSQVLNLVYPAGEDQATVSAALQKNVRDIVTEAGLSVANSQVLPVRERGNFDYLGVKLTVSGSLSDLDEALAGIAAYLPLVLVESLDVFAGRTGRNREAAEQQTVTASLQVLSLRAVQ